ncbi:hypothetical protein OG802_11125 [Streptomyces sp. NBC_00704]|uniref:hypothetical protein n=1 Tax=Streptomyces sp. NBC_00704 TaxID=2975809 RepID=UPI002E3540B0|nr:hypothetical protein [Streptomyces sp. NBC_00704]
MTSIQGKGDQPEEPGVVGEAQIGDGVRGVSHAEYKGGVVGVNDNDTPRAGPGVYGQSPGTGVVGESTTWHGVFGHTTSTSGGHGVSGDGDVGVSGVGRKWIGVYGETNADPNVGASGIWGDGKDSGDGVKGHAKAPGKAGVAGFQLGNAGPGIFGQGAPAGHFQGDVVVTGDLVLPGADYAEELTVASDEVTPGTVVVLDEAGQIRPCTKEYDARVAGVVSGGRGVKSSLVLDRHDNGAPVALMGKVWALADASTHPVRAGDMLTTSGRLGHAQVVTDPSRAFGAIIGKALTDLSSGRGLVRVLVTAG